MTTGFMKGVFMNLYRKVILLIICLSFASFPMTVQARTIPPAYEDMERYSEEEMKELPDLKVYLNEELDEGSLNNRTEVELKILRNSIFAQYGRSFSTPWLRRYFQSRKWYKEGKFKDNMLTKVDRKNVKMIQRYEDKLSRKEKEIIEMSYCEREESYSIERFVFSKDNRFVYETGSTDIYGRMYNQKKKRGLWAVVYDYVYYKFDEEGTWETLEVDSRKKTCL